MQFVTNALVIRAVDYKESDKILTVLTDERGKLTVSAHGARGKKSTILPSVQLFAYSEMVIFETRGRYSLNDAQVLEQFSGLSRDLDNMALASYFAQILDSEQEENRINPDVLRLALNCFFALGKGAHPRTKVKAAFELRYAALCGYNPLEQIAGRGGAINPGMDEAACRAAQYILESDLKRILSFTIAESSLKLLNNFTEKYLESKLERTFKTLDFYNSLGE